MKIIKKIILILTLILTLNSCMNTYNYNYKENDVVALMKTTNGTISILLDTELAPITTSNFIWLSKQWYYDWIIFHRVIKNFMIQWWDPTWTWMSWSSIYGEKFDDEFNSSLKNYKYTISMANSWKNTNGSQFFINVADNNYLDNKHSVFGRVVDWIENVDKISKLKTNSSDKPEKDVKIISIDVKQYKNGTLKDYDFDLEKAKDNYLNRNKKLLEDKKNMVVLSWSTVSVDYIWTFENGEEFDNSYTRGTPIEFVAWSWMMISWFDKAVIWMKIWEAKSIILSPKEAYWESSEDNYQVIPKTDLKSFEDAWYKLEKWVKLPTQIWDLEIISSDEKSVTVDANHPMAWKTLKFDIKIVDIN